VNDEGVLSGEEARQRPCFAGPAGEGAWNLLVRVQPGARKSVFAGIREGRLQIRLAAPAVENKANRALVAFVAAALGLKPAKVTLASGETGRQKRLVVTAEKEPDWTGAFSL
jgi:uncharacterized protein (TIGR00251 family)